MRKNFSSKSVSRERIRDIISLLLDFGKTSAMLQWSKLNAMA